MVPVVRDSAGGLVVQTLCQKSLGEERLRVAYTSG